MAKLYIVGTPIGNLSDITLRALDTLKSADVIACEDTRHSLSLLNRYEIKAQLVAYHKFNENECAVKLCQMVRDGKNVALITDAGMPCVSDPGATVVALCREQGVEVEVVPGPTALASAVALSGIKSNGFTFLGFLPEKRSDKVSVLTNTAQTGLPVVLYVAPHDLAKTAAFLLEVLGDRKVYVCRELTKIYEEVVVTTLAAFSCEERGEIVLIVDAPEKTDNPLLSLSVVEHFKYYAKEGLDRKEAIKRVAQERNLPKNEVYQAVLDIE